MSSWRTRSSPRWGLLWPGMCSPVARGALGESWAGFLKEEPFPKALGVGEKDGMETRPARGCQKGWPFFSFGLSPDRLVPPGEQRRGVLAKGGGKGPPGLPFLCCQRLRPEKPGEAQDRTPWGAALP